MTPKQRDHILSVIDKDANGHGWLALMRDGEPEVCILGGLAMEAGFTFEQLAGKTMLRTVRSKVDGETVTQRLRSMFGLTGLNRQQLIGSNDSDGWRPLSLEDLAQWKVGVHERRRARLREVVNGWPVS